MPDGPPEFVVGLCSGSADQCLQLVECHLDGVEIAVVERQGTPTASMAAAFLRISCYNTKCLP